MRRTFSLAVFALAALPAGIATASPRACGASQLAAHFRLIAGSAGAGHVTYRLSVENRGHSACSLGRPRLLLLTRTGRTLPSHPHAEGRRISVAAGRTVRADVRFSPDIPAGRERQRGACEPAAERVRVTFAGSPGPVVARVEPPTPVCQYGAMEIRALR